MDDAIYRKSGSAGAEGKDFQSNFRFMTLLRADDKYGDNFRLYSEWEKAGKFNDLVLIYKDDQDVLHHHLLQAKHVVDEKKTITYKDLISGDKFNIEKYFNSFKEIQKNFNGKIDDLILFSNLSLNANVEPFVDAIPFKHPIFHFQQNKKDGNAPVMHKLNMKFIEEYQYSKLRRIAKTFLDYCFKGIEMKATNNVFKDCHVILSTDVVNVTECKFRDAFIDFVDLSVETRQFRDILLEDLKTRNESFSSAETQTEWLRNIRMKFASGFGISTSKKETANGWPIALISPDDVELFKNFCKFFILASSQPNDEELIGHIRAEYKNRHSKSQVLLATDFLQNKLRNWFKKVTSNPLNSRFLEDALKYIQNNEKELKFIIETERNIQALSPLQLEFETILYEDQIRTFLKQNESSLLHIETNGNMKVSLIKLFYCFRKSQLPGYLFCPETELSKTIDLLEMFEDSQNLNILIVELQDFNKSQKVMEKLQNLIQNYNIKKKKKVIVVTKKGDAVVHPTHPNMIVADETYFEHLTAISRQELNDRRITFQGDSKIAINSILPNGIPLKHYDIQSWDCLMDETISINSNKDDIDLGYYINRTLHCECLYFKKSTIQEKLGNQHLVTYNFTDFNKEVQLHSGKHVHLLEELDGKWCWRTSTSGVGDLQIKKRGVRQLKFYDNDDSFLEVVNKILIISDPAGNGKTTITSYLATRLRKKNQHNWVTRLSSSRCSFTPDEIQLTAASDNSQYDLFLMKKLFEVSTPLERLIFEQYLKEEESHSKLIFIFDGFDEIDAESQTVIIRALKYLKEKPNVKFIGISTRPQHQQQLEKELQSRTWTLQPFNKNNQIIFLEKFWLSRATIEQRVKLRIFAERLITSISRSISEKEFELTGIPQQMRMISEIYEENAKKYVAGDIEEEFAFPPIDLFELYEQFIKKKEDVYLNDKLGIRQTAAQRSVTIKPFQKNQIDFALNTMLGSKLSLPEEDLEDCFGLGIIQKSPNNQFHFIHRTFAEFLTAKYLLDEHVSLKDKLQKGQLMRVLAQESFSVVRKFVDGKFNIEQMMAEFTKPENDTILRDINQQEFLDAIKTLLKEKIPKIFNFLMELLLFRIKRATGLRSSYVKRHNRIVYKTPLLYWMIIRTDNVVLLETFEYLLALILIHDVEELTTCLIEYQKRLEEEKIILNDRHLMSILWGVNPFREDVLFSFEYFRYLKYNKKHIFYAFLNEKCNIQTVMSDWHVEKFNKYRSEFYQLMEGDCDANFIFDHFVDGVGEEIQNYDADQIETYFKFLSKYTRLFDPPTLHRFQLFIEKLSRKKKFNLLKSEILLRFVIEHRDLFSNDVIIQNQLIHKNLTLIENCALWGWTDSLKLLLDVNDSELQYFRKSILVSIRERYSDEQLMKLASSCAYCVIPDSHIELSIQCQFLPNAIRMRDEFNLKIFTSWITTEELFISFMKSSTLTDEVIEFVHKNYPHYMMKCFKVNERSFVSTAACSKVIFEILRYDRNINEEEFWKLMKLKDIGGRTILFYVCWFDADSLNVWLNLLKKKCSNSYYIEQLYTILKPVVDKRLEFKINVRKKLFEFYKEMNYKDYNFYN